MTPLRVVDSGLRGARANMAMTAALLAARAEGRIPDTLRFFRFPPCVLIGRHQDPAAEIDLEQAAGIELARRPTGGGAVYIDDRQLCWEVALACQAPLDHLTGDLCRAVAVGLSGLGVACSFAPANDIEAAGRKICGTAGLVRGGAALLHGTLLLDADIDSMVRLLTPPAAKLARHGAATIAQRVTGLAALLGGVPSFAAARAAIAEGIASLGFSPYPGTLTDHEETCAAQLRAGPLGSDAFLWNGDVDAD
ncbi:Biotin/lipoate A/B protein ligase (fragment) [Magnetospirillum sp. LM-5]|uniref:lipoate--protein ligase family protein n=1 Tax=Magnetospirillum sp. LM-5 TaxID=2681466 RepID=UPI001383D1D9